MEEKKKDSDVGLIFLIMLMVGLVLAVMGLVFCVIKLKQEKAKNNDLTAKQNNNVKTVYVVPEDEEELEEEEIEEETETEIEKNEPKDLSFEELMNRLYLPKEIKEESGQIILSTTFDNVSGNYSVIHNSDIYGVTISTSGLISISNENRAVKESNIGGIEEEIVYVKIDSNEGEMRGIAFLTRNGNVFYLSASSISNNEFQAEQIPDLSKVIRIQEVTSTAEGAPGAADALLCLKYDGTYEFIP